MVYVPYQTDQTCRLSKLSCGQKYKQWHPEAYESGVTDCERLGRSFALLTTFTMGFKYVFIPASPNDDMQETEVSPCFLSPKQTNQQTERTFVFSPDHSRTRE